MKSQFGPNKLCLLPPDLVVRRPLCDLFGHETGFIPWSVGKYYLLPGARIPWTFLVHVLMKPSLENLEHYLASV